MRFGEKERTYDAIPGYYKSQGKPLAVQAAVGRKQLSRIEDLNGARRKNGQTLDQKLQGTANLLLPSYPQGSDPIYMSFVVHHSHRLKLCEALRQRGVDTTIGYMNDMSDHPLFQEYKRNCPNASKANRELLHIPVHPNLSEADVLHLVQAIQSACAEVD